MSLMIPYDSQDFPSAYGIGSGNLTTSWDDLLWAGLTVGRPNTAYVFQHGEASFYEALFRLSLIRMTVEQDHFGELRRADAFAALDPTEKGAVSYFLGMTLCKLFAYKLLDAPWLLHLDVFRDSLKPALLGRSRPDLVGLDASGRWHAFESKGRSGSPSHHDIANAKSQARRLIAVSGTPCSLQIGTFAYFRSDALRFYWCDPEPKGAERIDIPSPDQEWRYYYKPALSLASGMEVSSISVTGDSAQVYVEIHSEIHELLLRGHWLEAHELAKRLWEQLEKQGFRPDGLRVSVSDSWQRSLRSIEEDWR